MGPEAVDEELGSTLKLPLLSIPATMDSPERPGMLTPPLHASASVPFRWEEEPGKPKACTSLIALSNPKGDRSHNCLELPPRLLLMDPSSTKLYSPTVLGDPCEGRSKFQTSSFRMSGECYGSFRKSLSPERDHDQLGANAMVLSRRMHKDKGVFGSWRKKGLRGKRDGGGSYVFPSSVDRDSECSRDGEGSSSSKSDKITRIRRAGSFTTTSLPRSHFWATVFGGLKQVVPWGSRKVKKDGLLS